MLREPHPRIGFLQLCAAVVLLALLLGNEARSQERRPRQINFTLATQLGGSMSTGPVVLKPGDHPVEIRASDYNLGTATRTLTSVMPKSIAVSHTRAMVVDLYVPGMNNPSFRLNGLRIRTVKGSPGPSEGALAATFSDYDKSGHESLFVAGSGCLKLFHNDGDSFSDVTQSAGFPVEPGTLCDSIAVGDLDGDGFTDLLVAAYTNLERPPAQSVFTFPNDFAGLSSRLYRNNRNGTFTDITDAAGLGKNPGRARKSIFADFDNDHRLDILVLRDEKPPALYLNRGGWRFEDKTWDAGEDLTTHAFFEGFPADFNHDGNIDLALWSTHSFRLLLNQGNARFERTGALQMPEPRTSLFDFRGIVSDLDDNGFEDVITVDQNGRLHLYSNVAGKFEEMALMLPSGFDQSYLQALRVGDRSAPLLFSRLPDGRTALLTRGADKNIQSDDLR